MIDRETEKRVWQRVLGQESRAENIARLLRLSRAQAEDLKTLDTELYHREQLTLGVLTGLYELGEGKTLPADGGKQPKLPPQERLRRCRERCREMLLLCVRLENHPRYGALFTDLTRYRRACCALLDRKTGRK